MIRIHSYSKHTRTRSVKFSLHRTVETSMVNKPSRVPSMAWASVDVHHFQFFFAVPIWFIAEVLPPQKGESGEDLVETSIFQRMNYFWISTLWIPLTSIFWRLFAFACLIAHEIHSYDPFPGFLIWSRFNYSLLILRGLYARAILAPWYT